MYKVLWVCSVPPKEISQDMNKPASNGGGWIQGLYSMCIALNNIELSICFPIDNNKSIISGEVNGVKYFSFYQKANIAGISDPITINPKMISSLKTIMESVKPDILHIFGTENGYALSAFNVFGNSSRTVIHIQGLTSVIANFYDAGLPQRVTHMVVPSTIVRGTIHGQKHKMMLRGRNEVKLLSKSQNVMGRTEWDRTHCTGINRMVNYYYCNEILRDSFYTSREWNYEDCVKYTIFMSQGSYPLKGLHMAIEAVNKIKEYFPDVILIVAGPNPVKVVTIKSMLSISSYGVYIRRLIKKYSLEKNIKFIGSLSEKDMVMALHKTNTYLMASYMENSPNSLAEAMMLGVPCVASDVGGVASMMSHNKEGFSYQHDDPQMLAYYVMKTFRFSDEMKLICSNARKRAIIDHSIENVRESLLTAYKEIYKDI